MKHYAYISDAKVDLLIPQLPRAVREARTAELKVSTGFMSALFKSERSILDSRVSRLDAVVRHVLSREDVGTVSRPGTWFTGTHRAHHRVNRRDGVVLFVGKVGDTYFVLGGSVKHMIGAPPGSEHFGGSMRVTLFPAIRRLRRQLLRRIARAQEMSAPEGERENIVQRDDAAVSAMDDWAQYAKETVDPGPWGRMMSFDPPVEFLARTLAVHRDGEHRFLLGTPLYVSDATAGGDDD